MNTPPLNRSSAVLNRARPTRLLAYALILLAGATFFWMNTRPPQQRGRLFWEMKIFAHWPDRFCDLGITLAFLESDHKGYPVAGPCNTGPGLIYGKGVLWLGRLGFNRLTVPDSIWLGFLLAAAFLLCVAITFRGSTPWHALYYAPLLISPPVFLGLERGNLDLFVYCAVVLAVVLTTRYGEGFGYAVIFVVGTMKYYPFAGVLALLRPVRRSWLYLLAVVAGAAALLLLSLDAARVAASLGPARFAWGYPVIFQLGPPILRAHGFDAEEWTHAEMLWPTSVCCLLALAAGWRWREELRIFIASKHRKTGMYFLAGCAIYAGCFLASMNYEYRNVFILLLVPHLLLATARRGYQRTLASAALAVILSIFVLSWFHNDDYPFLVYQLCYWLLFCFCAPLCLAAFLSAVPEEVSSRVRNAFQSRLQFLRRPSPAPAMSRRNAALYSKRSGAKAGRRRSAK